MVIKYLDSKRISALSSDVVNTPTYEDDFSTDTLGANTTDATYIDWDGSGAIDLIAPVSVATGGGDSGWFDLTTVSDSVNVVRFSLDTSAITVGITPQMWIGLSSIGTGDSTTTNDWFGMYMQASAGNPIIIAGHANGIGCNNATSDSTFTKTLAVEKIWVEIIRTSTTAFTLNIFSDEYVTLTESKTGVTTSVTSTTNFRMITRNSTGTASGWTLKLGDLKFYNGVSSLTNKPTNVQDNSILVEKDTAKRFWYSGSSWTWENYVITRGVWGGGTTGTIMNTIDYITIATTGNATDFGDLTVARDYHAAVNSDVRGVWGGGNPSTNVMDYITVLTTGNATDFGDLTIAKTELSGCDSDVRGLFGGGTDTGGNTNVIEYITIATVGNATDFGDLTLARRSLAALSSSVRGVFGGGDAPSNVMDYVTIATAGNATDFGDLTLATKFFAGGVNSDVRGVWGGGYSGGALNVMSYITIATAGNATDFGDLTASRYLVSGCNSDVRGVFGGGNGNSNIIDYITIATTGNATDFGDLTLGRQSPMGLNG